MSRTLQNILKFMWHYLVGSLLIVVLAVPVIGQAATSSAEQQYRAALLQMIAVLQQQIALLQAELAARTVTVVDSPLLSQVTVTQSYVVGEYPDLSQITDHPAQAYFTHMYQLLPDDYDTLLGRLVVFQGDSTGVSIDAFVETIPPQHTTWLYAVHEAVLERAFDTELVVHELGHMVSYQAPLGVAVPVFSDECAAYFSEHGCPAPATYLHQFVDRFWSSADLDRAERFADAADPVAAAVRYYKLHQDQYVSDYAALSPEEDFSESFVYFVFGRDTGTGGADTKVAFFAQFPELVALKQDMRTKL